MSQVQQFSQRVEDRLLGTGVISSTIISILVPAVIQILADMLGNCGGGVERAKELMRHPGDWRTQRAARLAVLQANREENLGMTSHERRIARNELLTACSECGNEFMDAGIEEIDRANKDIGYGHMLV